MGLDLEHCVRIVEAQDPRFDGWLYCAVKSTGVYCPPELPCANAEAAEHAVLRERRGRSGCRVQRQLHRRLVEAVGVGPLALARRAQTARLLLATTDLPMFDVATAVGFHSVRQFNATMRAVFGETPRALRRPERRAAQRGPGEAIELELAARHRGGTASVLEFLAARSVDGVEEVTGEGAYRRSLRLPHGSAVVQIAPSGAGARAKLRLADVRDLLPAVQRCRRLLDLDSDSAAVHDLLAPDLVRSARWCAATPAGASPATSTIQSWPFARCSGSRSRSTPPGASRQRSGDRGPVPPARAGGRRTCTGRGAHDRWDPLGPRRGAVRDRASARGRPRDRAVGRELHRDAHAALPGRLSRDGPGGAPGDLGAGTSPRPRVDPPAGGALAPLPRVREPAPLGVPGARARRATRRARRRLTASHRPPAAPFLGSRERRPVPTSRPATPGGSSSMNERIDPHRISLPRAAQLLAGAPWCRVVGIGDSIVAGVGEPLEGYDDRAAAERVTDALAAVNRDLIWHNLAVRDMRLDAIQEEQLPAALELRPDLMLVSGGGNDAMRRRFEPDRIREDLLALLTPIVDAGIDVALMGLFDIWRSGVIPEPVASNLAPRFDEFDRLSAEVAAAVGAIFIDLHSHPHARDPAIFASDRMHCNARGHAIAGTVAIEALAERLASRER